MIGIPLEEEQPPSAQGDSSTSKPDLFRERLECDSSGHGGSFRQELGRATSEMAENVQPRHRLVAICE